ncbi:hypothetical protein ACH4ZX_14735 [Streptomyces sp. NPDC020490]|uniref:hypothetical protein n=1 Tax=Streptomyces sp. NPDC020490 TaxID=3365078 RepID=UPI0037BA3AB9
MATREPDDSTAAGDGHHAAPVPEDVWRRFAADSERAIRRSAPREPSARERLSGASVRFAPDGANRERGAGHAPSDAVGELWQPQELTAGPAWRDLDGPGRRRRVCRVLGTVAAVVLLLSAASHLSTGPRQGRGVPGGTTLQQSEDVPAGSPAGATSRPEPDDTAPTLRAG